MKSLIAFLILTAISITGYAQQTAEADGDWAENQRIAERIAYWHSFEIAGPDTNVVEARIRGFNEFISIPRYTSNGKMMTQSTSAWQQVGGSQGVSSVGHVSGRPTSIAFDPQSVGVFYIGTSGGGLWKTSDQGATWANLSDSWTSYAMGGVAVDPTDGKVIYAATGDMFDQSGDGFYKSVDGGLNWTHTATASVIGSQCNQVLVDAQVHTTVYVTGTNGVYRSLDAGVTWKHILPVSGVTHMVIDPSNTQNLYAGGAGAIKKSTDGGTTWSANDIAAGISGKYTITLAISKAAPTTIYASLGNGNTGGSLGLGRSDDAGATWKLIWSSSNYMGQQEFYDNACAVNPSNSKNLLVGGLDIWGSTTGGTSFFQYTNWTHSSETSDFTHADIHVLAYGGPGLFALTDGGIFLSTNNGTSWQQKLNNKLSTMLFVGGDAAPDFSFVLGGAQDNGLNYAPIASSTFVQSQGGDGGRCFISQGDGGSTAYGTYVGAVFYKSSTGGSSWLPGNMLDNAGPDGQTLENEGTPFYMMYDVSESGDGSNVAICGNSNLYYSSDGVNSLYNITTASVSPKALKAVHITAADPSVVYAGTGTYVYVTQNAADLTGVTWTKSTKSIGSVAGFATDPNDASKAWCVISGFGNSHFFRSTDFGKTWTAPATNLPNLDARTIARAPNGNLFIGTTFGVLYSLDNGVTWGTLRDGMPLCQITKLRVRGTNSQWLLATTYGRGMYKLDITSLPPITPSGVAVASTSPDMPVFNSISPNPIQANGNATVNFTLQKEGNVTLELYNERGIEVKTLIKSYLQPGEQSAIADLSGLASGVYFAVLTSNGYSVTQRLVVTK
jgi:hypothetical protein